MQTRKILNDSEASKEAVKEYLNTMLTPELLFFFDRFSNQDLDRLEVMIKTVIYERQLNESIPESKL